MAEDYLNLKAVTLQAYKRLLEDPETQAAAYGVAVLVIRNATQCPLKICCALLRPVRKSNFSSQMGTASRPRRVSSGGVFV